jgi:hypothetical protein
MDIIEIIEDAKKHLMEHGDHIPTLFVEFEGKDLVMIVFADLPDIGFTRQKKFFVLGRKTALEHKGKRVQYLYFISEAWGLHLEEGEERGPHKNLGDDPRRKELLTIQTMDASTPPKLTQLAYSAEMIRYEGKFLDLGPMDAPMECHNKLLIAFLAGALSTELSDKELGKLVGKYM